MSSSPFRWTHENNHNCAETGVSSFLFPDLRDTDDGILILGMAFSFRYNPAMVSSKDLLSNVLVGVKRYGRSRGCRAKDENSAI